MLRTHLTAALACAVALVMAPAAVATGGHGSSSDSKKLRKGVTVSGILEHERALQRIAIAHDNTRAATTEGYNDSVDYVVGRLERAGYNVSLDGFDFPIWNLNSPSTLARISPSPATFVEGSDYIVSQFSGAGDLTANVVPTTDIQIPPPGGPGTGTSGCEPGDFPATTAGNIALMQRGTCPFVQKYQMAKNAGAIAALIFNDGFEGRTDPLFITAPVNIGIPTIMISSALGEALNSQPSSMHVKVDATTTPHTEFNVIADSKKGDPKRTIVVGAHLDSVEAGPGINDNGSGSAGILEIAEQISKLRDHPRNRLRFAFWGAEEAGLVGSTAYVADQVANGGIAKIEANLNFDMIGSPNFVRFVYDGDTSDTPPPPGGAPAGSGQIEQIFLRYFRSQGLTTDPTAFDGRSDYGPFIANGVPAGGLFTGAEGIKTARQEAIYGGFAGLAFDPCYHQACDTFFNLNYTALDQMSDAAADATWTLANSKKPPEELSGTSARKGKRVKHWKFKGPFRVR